MPAGRHLRTLDTQFFSTGQPQVAGRADVTAKHLLLALRALAIVAEQAEQLAAAVALGGNSAGVVCLDRQGAFFAVQHRVLGTVDGAALDAHLFGRNVQLAIGCDSAASYALTLGIVAFAVTKKGTRYQVATVVAACALFLQRRCADFDVPGVDVQAGAAVQLAALHGERVIGLDRHARGIERAALC
ncbi:hypothetical protein D3C81_823050 [compost metagenome]